MLFKNIRSGNIIDVQSPDAIEIMRASPIYEEVEKAAPKPDSAPKTVRKKTAGKTTK